MKKILYSVRDDLNDFGSVFVAPSDGFAKRDFASAVNNPGPSAVAFSPKDFALYRLGTFDSETGLIQSEPVPVLIVRGDALVGA